MPKQVLFVQGAGENVHDAWDDKLVESLRHELGEDYVVLYPRMPEEDDPRYPVWKEALLHELGALDDGAILVGHSVGGAILIHVLAEERPQLKPGALVLIAAPFIGEGGWPSDEIQALADFDEPLPAVLPVLLYHGTQDDIVPFGHLQLYAKTMPKAVVHCLDGRDHQLGNDLGCVARDIRSLG